MCMYVFTADMPWQIPIMMTKKSMPLSHWHSVFAGQNAFSTLHRCVCQVGWAGKAVMGSTVRSVAIFGLHHQCLSDIAREMPPSASTCSLALFPPSHTALCWSSGCTSPRAYPPQVSHLTGRKKWNIGYKGEKFWKIFFGFYLESSLGNQSYFSLLLEA